METPIHTPHRPHDRKAERLLRRVIDIVVKDMKARVKAGESGPEELDTDTVYELISSGVLQLRLRKGNPPRPELIVIPKDESTIN